MNTAILFDTMSIQQYVFGSNKLKDNLGASDIIENIYLDLKNNPELTTGYIGGGNALFFTTCETKAKEIVMKFTTNLLHRFPGVSLAVAIKENFGKDKENYSHDIKELFKILAKNKGKYLPVNTIPSHGITDVCRFSSLSVEVYEKYSDKTFDFMSSSTASKRIYQERARNVEKDLLKDDSLKNYCFPDEFEDLGQQKGEDSHIAVVHIDGNGFGEVFRNLITVDDTEVLSKKIKEVVREAFIYTLTKYVEYEEFFEKIVDKKSYLNNILPIRPIVLGGDDVTFVCHGKLGIWFAERFMEKFQMDFTLGDKIIPFSSCAGVAVVKTKYPFYRAYQMAEDLCTSAKKMNKEHGGNWIDFQLAYSGLGNTLEEIRKLHYYDIKGKSPLFNRPYCVDQNNSFEALKVNANLILETLPKSKIKDLREILTQDIESQKLFIEHLKHQHDEKNGFKAKFGVSESPKAILDENPFFDMIELLELYPTNLLK